MSKQINIGGRLHSTEQGNVITGANEVLDDTKGKKQNVINADVDAELLRLDQSKQNNLTFDNTPTENSNNPVKSSGVYAADKALSDAIEAILILIPSAATALNQLADKNFVNSSIATDTATFRGTSETGLSEAQFLEWANSLTHDMNDYVFWQTIDEAGNTLFKRYKWNGTQWLYEYTLNNSSFTADQWAAITSGITTALVEKLVGLPTNAALQQALNSKQNSLTFDNVPTENSTNPVKSGGVYSAVKAEENARLNLAQTVSKIGGDVSQIEDVIPTGATVQNKLVANASMEAYVASIIQNITASFTLSTTDGHINLTLTQVNGRVATLTLASSDIASAQALTALTGRVTTAEGNITSLTGRVSTNEIDIANLQQLYNDIQQSKPVPVTALPSTGQQQGVIYRLAGTTSYSDYMWNGSTWVLMATYNNAIDDEPTAGSDNLVKSGGIAKSFGLWCYFTQDNIPSFEISGTTITVTMPTKGGFKVYTGAHILLHTINTNGQSFTLNNINRLVLNSNGTMEVVDNDHTGSYIVLVSNKYGRIGGLFADYYYNRVINDVRDQVNTYMWWSGGGDPVISISEETVSVTFPAGKYWNIKRKDGIFIESYMSAGVGQTFEVGSYKVLIFDRTDRTVKVVNNDSDALKNCFVFLMNVKGKYFTGLLEPFIVSIIKDNATIATASAYFVGLSNPEIWLNGTTINIAMPSDNNTAIRVYLTDGNIFYISDAIGKTFAIPNLNRLVFDKSDNTTKVVANDAAGNYYNLLVNCNLNVSGLLSTYYRQYQVSIKALYDNQKEKLVFQNLKKTNSTIHGAAGFTPLVLLHFSDLHSRPENLKRIMQYHDMFASRTVGGSQVAVIDDILNTGDTINSSTDSYDFYSNIPGTEKILTAIGNHEYTPPQGESAPSQLEVYNKEIGPFIDDWDVVQPDNAATEGLCYYYKDYANSGVRLIVLDDFAANMSAQVSWLENVLADAKTNNLAVVCAIHFPANMNYLKNISFCSIDAPDGMIYVIPTEMLNAIDTFISGGGEFVCWLTGHTHEDMFGTIIDHTNQVCVTVSDAGWDGESGSCVREVGTKSQDCFNLFSADRNTKCLKLHRVGVDRDRYMRHIGELCYNYETKTLVYNN